jgi:hypothetical protein
MHPPMRPLALIAGSVAVACGSHGSSSAPLASDAALNAAAAVSIAVSPPLGPSAPPLYDLAADLAARLEGARAEFGDATASDVEAGVFLLVAPRRTALYDASVKLARDALDAYFNDRFSRRPERAVSVYIFAAQAPYDAFRKRRLGAPCTSAFGFYQRSTREIFVNAAPGIPTLTHELVHPIVQSEFPDAPAWINEGLGSLFEMPVIPAAGEIHGAKNGRLSRLRAALSSKTERATTRLDALFGMTDASFHDGDEELHYAMARYACQWLDARGKLWPFYRAWRDGVTSDPTGEKAFAQVMDTTPALATSRG